MKQKKRVVDPTRKVVAADTGTYRLGRNGRGGAEAAPPTPPPTPPPLKPGIRGKEREEEDREGGRDLLPTYCKGCFSGQNGKSGVYLGGGAMTAEWKGKPTLCKAAAEWRHDRFAVSGLEMSPGTTLGLFFFFFLFFLFSNIQHDWHVYTFWEIFVCVHNL